VFSLFLFCAPFALAAFSFHTPTLWLLFFRYASCSLEHKYTPAVNHDPNCRVLWHIHTFPPQTEPVLCFGVFFGVGFQRVGFLFFFAPLFVTGASLITSLCRNLVLNILCSGGTSHLFVPLPPSRITHSHFPFPLERFFNSAILVLRNFVLPSIRSCLFFKDIHSLPPPAPLLFPPSRFFSPPIFLMMFLSFRVAVLPFF